MKTKYAKCHRHLKQKKTVHACLPTVNHKKIQRLMRELGLQVRSRKGKKFTTYRCTIGHIAPNRLKRDFTATAPNI